ncbi:BolA family transcriptional regulator [Trinickia dabaoshanensis]|uniref:BolA family transcriptional regulator n=1 Tax=Trinickia dabaoshanensis TaxID=564714 RepID=A0A2N7VGM5_9BURK|nr:BolA family protein [Trinickia dabaoshanensis]PMS16308.1 BolA family transcriptional regulator [Trinickia dabaoshanensis]
MSTPSEFLDASAEVRIAFIEARLSAALAPESVAVRDDSAQHAGHAGAAAGGHYTVTIVAAAFAGKPRVARHRLVYDALADVMQRGIHALAIMAYTPEEFARLPGA